MHVMREGWYERGKQKLVAEGKRLFAIIAFGAFTPELAAQFSTIALFVIAVAAGVPSACRTVTMG